LSMSERVVPMMHSAVAPHAMGRQLRRLAFGREVRRDVLQLSWRCRELSEKLSEVLVVFPEAFEEGNA